VGTSWECASYQVSPHVPEFSAGTVEVGHLHFASRYSQSYFSVISTSIFLTLQTSSSSIKMTSAIHDARLAIIETQQKLHNELRLMPTGYPDIFDRLDSLADVDKRLSAIQLLDEKSSPRQQRLAVKEAMDTCRSCAPLSTKKVEYTGFEKIGRDMVDIGVVVMQIPVVIAALVLL
jgi:hypothetical protein